MTKANLKTKKNKKSVSDFLNSISNPVRKRDAKTVLKLMKDITKKKPTMWGPSIVGFGEYHYKYESGREADFLRIGFSPRKAALTLYIMPGYQDYGDLLKKLGPHSTGKACLYIRDMEEIHLPTLKKIIARGWKDMEKLYPNA